ncbi:hypothetical protein [Halorubellus salinus]|uniref:hypothetical protein n=1 Tax=Halorubellus salinus TaxID=755309 RepID=UPI001D0958A6|nr:hypothetical protein [Halorubellus salinus]
MNKTSILLVGLLVIAAVPTSSVAGGQISPEQELELAQTPSAEGIIERTFRTRGTEYVLRVNVSNHTLRVSAEHFADNKTNAAYAVQLNNNRLISRGWRASEGETSQSQVYLLNKYYAGDVLRNITLYTHEKVFSFTYNFTVPRKHNGRYLRPTVTNVAFEQVNRTHGRVFVTARSDTKHHYPAYARVWTPDVDAKLLYLHSGGGDNKTTESLIVPVAKGEKFEGEIWIHADGLNETGPLHAKWEFYGRPGNAHFNRVPFEPMKLNRVSEYTYVNESASDSGRFEMSDREYRRVLGGIGVVLLLIVVVGVLLGRRRRRV